MWVSFIAAFLCGILTMAVPGYFISRTMLSNPLHAIAFSPTASIALFLLVGLAIYPVSISAGNFYLITLIFSLIIFLLFRRTRAAIDIDQCSTLLLYVFMGAVLTVLIFLRNIDGPSSYSVQTDTTFHLSCAKAMLDSGRYSILHASEYPDLMSTGQGVFYPAAWHIITAITSGISKTNILIAHNAINFIICAFVYPLSTWLFLSAIFKSDKGFNYAGGIVCNLFSYFPWAFLIVGQLDSNLLSNAILPSFLSIFYQLVTCGEFPADKTINKSRMGFPYADPTLLCTACISFIALAGSQTNAIFSAGVICIPLIIQFCWKTMGRHTNRISLQILVSSLTAGLIVILWLLVYSLPFIQPIVNVYREPTASPLEALKYILLLKFGQPVNAQPVLGLFVGIGFISAFFNKKFRWLSISYVLVAALAFICMSLDHPLRQLLCGFWYSGIVRLNGTLAIIACPLAAIGLYKLIDLFTAPIFNRERCKPSHLTILSVAFCTVVLFVFAYPKTMSYSKNNYKYLCDQILADYSLLSSVSISPAERHFIDSAKQIIGNDRVINIPSDGSIWLYATDNINIISRQFYSTPYKEYELFKTSLCEISNNTQVYDAIQTSSARYVLILDETVNIGYFDPSDWKGILNITDETAGFTCLLSDGSMRLYQIE